MSRESQASGISRAVVAAFLIFSVIGLLLLLAEALKPLALAILLAFALSPLVRLLEKAKLPRLLAIFFSLIIAMGVLGGIAYVVGAQLVSLVTHLPDNEQNILRKLDQVQSGNHAQFARISKVATDLIERFQSPPSSDVVRVAVVRQPSVHERVRTYLGPQLEVLGMGILVLILVAFLLAKPEDLTERIIRVFGRGRMSLTTRTLNELGGRISRWLASFAAVNACFGILVGLGLWIIGLPYAALWGVIAATFRFVPYAGPAGAFLLPWLFSIAHFPGWRGPLEIAGIFFLYEIIFNILLEPWVYGKSTGVSSLGLVISAGFWTWLWGPVGLLLSTSLTVTLAVIGKFVPALSVFDIFLSERSGLGDDLRFYHRLLERDRSGALEIVNRQFGIRSELDVFDKLLAPALARARRDCARGDVGRDQRRFIIRAIRGIIADRAKNLTPRQASPGDSVAGVAARGAEDGVVLEMLRLSLARDGVSMHVISNESSPLILAHKVAELEPRIVLISSLSPGGRAKSRYLALRLKASYPSAVFIDGHWRRWTGAEPRVEDQARLRAKQMVTSLSDAKARLLELLRANTIQGSIVPEQAPA